MEVLVIEASDTLVIVNEDLVMSQYNFTPECKLQEIMAVSFLFIKLNFYHLNFALSIV